MIVIGFILGVIVGIGVAYLITALLVKSSNDLGDSVGQFKDFSKESLKVIEKKDGVSRNYIPGDYW